MNERFRVFMNRHLFVSMLLLALGLSATTAFGQDIQKLPSSTGGEPDSLRSMLTASPWEINLGILGPGEEAEGKFYLMNTGSETSEWFAEVPKGWTLPENGNLSGIVGRLPEQMRIRLVNVREIGASGKRCCAVILHLEAGGHAATFHRNVPVGNLREEVRFNYDGGTASFFFRAKLATLASNSLMDLEPLRMDFGAIQPGGKISKRLLLKNRGREPLTWKAGVAGGRGMPTAVRQASGQYVSFRNETAGTGSYSSGDTLPKGLELSGQWEQERGYPSAQGEQAVLRYRFTGTGIGIYFWKSPEGGPLSLFFDEQLVKVVDGSAENRERGETLVIAEQPEGPHLLTVVNGMGKVTLEGVRIFGKTIRKGPRGWITVFPDSGFTAREMDYINIAIDTRDLTPGIYEDQVFFTSNGGEADVEVFIEVAAETASLFLDVHRYVSGSDYLYTTNPQAESSRIQLKGYRHDGIVFYLFTPGTSATTDFFRWFNPSKRDHYYSYDPEGGKPLPGYIFEGSIGNIATSRLTGTRELYRWFNSKKDSHFYTTDQAGEGLAKKGYRFDGIAGFVR
jgi:hypothetical protein